MNFRFLALLVLTFFVGRTQAGPCEIEQTEFGDGTTFVTAFLITKDGQEIHRTIFKNEAELFAREAEICGGSGVQIPDPLLQAGYYRGTNKSAWFWKECSLEIHNGQDGKPRLVSVQDSDHVFNLWLANGIAFEASAPGTVVSLGEIGFDAFYKGIRKNVYSTSIAEKVGHFSLIVRRDSNRAPESFNFRFKTRSALSEIECAVTRGR